ncbi:PulJ/GspJ family protein [Sporosarcina obsidiansis]|uniref:PulJ/GspJ family protein n=1 Tax=Sporosarcina obsidiansis TaxID=2660748 RepID=UPI00129AF1C5|nr:prepilin-type N-terminal cleavage/methylation domain-containing protein [Sporosarcina obsidiansis]
MKNNEGGMTLIEVLATLVLLSLISGIIWSAILISTKFNIAENSTLHLQQESNYIIAELQRIHRKCDSYTIAITKNAIEVSECKNDKLENLPEYIGVISQGYEYGPEITEIVTPAKDDLRINNLILTDTLNSERNRKRHVEVSTVISRYITEDGTN